MTWKANVVRVFIVLLALQAVMECKAQSLPPMLLSIRPSPAQSQVELCWNTTTNTWYLMEYCPSLTTNWWAPMMSVFGNGSQICTNDTVLLGNGQRIYRVSSQPVGPSYLGFANLGAGFYSQFRDQGVPLSGGGYSVEMLVGLTSASVTNSLSAVAVNFSSGFFNAGRVTVPTADIDSTGKAWVIVRV